MNTQHNSMCSRAGFTLIETLVYIGLFTLIIGGLVSAAYVLLESVDRNQTKAMLQEEEKFILAKIAWALDGASGVDLSKHTLAITRYDSTHLTVSTTGSDVYINADRLNNTNVTVGDLSFVRVGVGSGVEGVEMHITASTKISNGMNITQSASTTRYIRK
ncbi:prepilin-type N-terminal cleavage/methylation domain-containing protein [Candidatus Kaiserbacteria bacterium]|nr:prepilin-type N-terminal cleavage/methylation domain-containing protein [Candidatus Kaiserbacteria bacterium]